MVKITSEELEEMGVDWEKLDALAAQVSNSRPPNSFTAHDYAERYDIHDNTARRHLAKLEKEGRVIRITEKMSGIQQYYRVADEPA